MRFSRFKLLTTKTFVIIQLSKINGSRISCLETSTWQQLSIVRSNLRNIFESRQSPRRSNAICLVTVERSKSCDTVSIVRLNSRQWTIPVKEVCLNFGNLPWFLARPKISNFNNISIQRHLGFKLKLRPFRRWVLYGIPHIEILFNTVGNYNTHVYTMQLLHSSKDN